jgi:hypothetical protein
MAAPRPGDGRARCPTLFIGPAAVRVNQPAPVFPPARAGAGQRASAQRGSDERKPRTPPGSAAGSLKKGATWLPDDSLSPGDFIPTAIIGGMGAALGSRVRLFAAAAYVTLAARNLGIVPQGLARRGSAMKRFFDPNFDTQVITPDGRLRKWLESGFHELVMARLKSLEKRPLTKVQFNQLLVLSLDASISDGFFEYYWRRTDPHPYDVNALPGYRSDWLTGSEKLIRSLDHLAWGLERVYIDALLYFGNVRAAFKALRSMSLPEIQAFFALKRFDTEAIGARGPALPLNNIAKDDRYLISEMACKTFGEVPDDAEKARLKLKEALAKHLAGRGGKIGFRDLLLDYVVGKADKDQLLLSYDDVIDTDASTPEQLDASLQRVLEKFFAARKAAIENTSYYLSMVNDLDVYVATSMRTRKNFRDMAEACEKIFGSSKLQHLHLRYFDPTMSAAKGHEDKGIIECLMVKCARLLVYCEGEKESYGKDAEAAMALSLGKPVIFYCDHGVKTNFYRDVHPLSRLIDFSSGVAVGAIVSDSVEEVAELIRRVFENKMEYRLEQHPNRPKFLKLIETLTGSVVRLQTDDPLITETFWNNYHNRRRDVLPNLAAGKEVERPRPS